MVAVLSFCCIVVCGLLGLEEMAATGIAAASESTEVATSLSVSVATSAFCVPEIKFGGVSTTLMGAVMFTVCETFDASLGRLACFVGRV